MLRIAGIIILMAPFFTNAQDCYPLNSGNGLYLFSPFIMGTPHGVPQLKGASFGDYANSSCGGEPRKWSIAAYNFNGKAAAILPHIQELHTSIPQVLLQEKKARLMTRFGLMATVLLPAIWVFEH